VIFVENYLDEVYNVIYLYAYLIGKVASRKLRQCPKYHFLVIQESTCLVCLLFCRSLSRNIFGGLALTPFGFRLHMRVFQFPPANDVIYWKIFNTRNDGNCIFLLHGDEAEESLMAMD